MRRQRGLGTAGILNNSPQSGVHLIVLKSLPNVLRGRGAFFSCSSPSPSSYHKGPQCCFCGEEIERENTQATEELSHLLLFTFSQLKTVSLATLRC